MLLKKDAEERIISKIKQIKKCHDWSQFDIDICIDDIDLSKLNYREVVAEKSMWENVAKLSIDLFIDFDYYRHFVFESRYNNTIYVDLLTNLGAVCINGKWNCVRMPESSVVYTNVFVCCLYRLIYDELVKVNTADDDVRESMLCFFCGYKIGECDDQCNQCDASVNEIRLQYDVTNEKTSEEKENVSIKQQREEVQTVAVINDRKHWSCQHCEYLNTYGCDACFMCNARMSDSDGWVCEICSTGNCLYTRICDGCGNVLDDVTEIEKVREIKIGNDTNDEVESRRMHTLKGVNEIGNRGDQSMDYSPLCVGDNLVGERIGLECSYNVAESCSSESAANDAERNDDIGDNERRLLEMRDSNEKVTKELSESDQCENVVDTDENESEIIGSRNKRTEAAFSRSSSSIDDDSNIISERERPEAPWTCTTCGLFNSGHEDRCGACNAYTPHKKPWSCDRCSFINDPLAKNCAVCSQVNRKSSASPDYSSRSLYNRISSGPISLESRGRLSSVRCAPRRFRGRGRSNSLRRATQPKRYIQPRQARWQCKYCNDSNDDHNGVCDTCGEQQDSGY